MAESGYQRIGIDHLGMALTMTATMGDFIVATTQGITTRAMK